MGGCQREEACCWTKIEGTCLEALVAYQAHCCNSEWELEIKIKQSAVIISLQSLLIIKELSVPLIKV